MSLKSLYKLLMTSDFPIYSESVIGEKGRKGQTVLRFWQRQLVDDFRTQTYGKMIWRNNGKRNRYTSHLCNRSSDLKCYEDYARELASQINEKVLMNQIVRFAGFLSEKDYKHDVLIRRIQEMIRLLKTDDPCVSQEITAQIAGGLVLPQTIQHGGIQGNLFQAAYLLTLMTFYAAAGEAMDSPTLAVLREKAYAMESMWESYNRRKEKNTNVVGFLTNHSGILQDSALPRHRFFGREEELYDLTEMAGAGRKCILSGIGGMGKTELLRQLISHCCEENAVDTLAIVPYEMSLVESFRASFPDCQNCDPVEVMNIALARIRREAEEKSVLLLIDNVTFGPEEDNDLKKLTDLPCGVLVTTRQSSMKGFETYRLSALPVSTGTLIFRDNYGSPMSPEDRSLLRMMLQEEILCHPLTLRLMARAARGKNWTVQELKKHLESDVVSQFWHDGDVTVRLSKFYQQLYAYHQIPEKCRFVAELFTLLPRNSYNVAFLKKWFPDIRNSGSEAELEMLAEKGWLDKDSAGYSMHPFIAQCLRKKVITERKIDPVLRYIRSSLRKTISGLDVVPDDSDIHQICYIVRYISNLMTGSVSKDWFITLAYALYDADNSPQIQSSTIPMLERFEKRCAEQDDEVRLHSLILRCNWLIAEREQYFRVYESQKKTRTVSEPLFWELCLHAGYCAVFRHADYPLAEKLLREVLNGQVLPIQKAKAYSYMINCCHSAGKIDEAVYWAEEGYRFVHAHPECGERMICQLLSLLCQLYCIRDLRESAAALIPELKKRCRETKAMGQQYYLLVALVSYESDYGSLDDAQQYQQQVMGIIEKLRGKSLDYFIEMGNSALLLQRMKCFEESIALYQEALDFYRAQKNGYWIQNLCGNAAVACMGMEQPEQAIAYLNEGYGYASEMGGFAQATYHYRYSGAYGQLGDTEREYDHLKASIPAFEEHFGAGNPRCVSARKRLAELEILLGKN